MIVFAEAMGAMASVAMRTRARIESFRMVERKHFPLETESDSNRTGHKRHDNCQSASSKIVAITQAIAGDIRSFRVRAFRAGFRNITPLGGTFHNTANVFTAGLARVRGAVISLFPSPPQQVCEESGNCAGIVVVSIAVVTYQLLN